MSRRALAIYAFFILLYGVLCYFANRFAYFPGDVSISSWLQGINFAGIEPTMRFAPYIVLGVVVLAVLVSLRLRLPSRRREISFIALTTLAAGIIVWLIKLLVNRPRPDIELVQIMEGTIGSAFPSMHVACATVICGFLLYLAPRLVKTPAVMWLLRALLIALIIFTGVSRIYLGAHWASDVVGGLFLGGLLLYPAIVSYNRYKAKRGRKHA
jgi:membrane-associated phospholipid phosphatase